eukprot:40359_1
MQEPKLDSITTQIEAINATLSKIQTQVNDLQLRITEEQKHNDGSKFDKLENKCNKEGCGNGKFVQPKRKWLFLSDFFFFFFLPCSLINHDFSIFFC